MKIKIAYLIALLCFALPLVFPPVSFSQETKVRATLVPPVAPGTRLGDAGFGQSYTASMFVSLFYKIYPNTELARALMNLEENLRPIFPDITLCFDKDRAVLYLIRQEKEGQFIVYCFWPDKELSRDRDPVFVDAVSLPLSEDNDQVVRDIMGFIIKKYQVNSEVRGRMLELMFENNLPVRVVSEWTDVKVPEGKTREEINLVELEKDMRRIKGAFTLSGYRNCKVDKGDSEFVYWREDVFSHEIFSWKMPAGIRGQVRDLRYLVSGRVFCLVSEDRGEAAGEEKRYRQSLIVWDIASATYHMLHFNVSQEAPMVVLPDGRVLLSCDGQIYAIVPDQGKIADISISVTMRGDEREIYLVNDMIQESKDPQKVLLSSKVSGETENYLLRLDFNAKNEEDNVSGFLVPVAVSSLYYADSRRILLKAGKSVGILATLEAALYLVSQRQGRLLMQTEFCAAWGRAEEVFAVSRMNRGLLLQRYHFRRELPERLTIRMFAKNFIASSAAAVCLTRKGMIVAGGKTVGPKTASKVEQEQIVEMDPQLSIERIIRLRDERPNRSFSKISENDRVIVAALNDNTIYIIDIDNERIKQYYDRAKMSALADLVKSTDIWRQLRTKLLDSFFMMQEIRERKGQ